MENERNEKVNNLEAKLLETARVALENELGNPLDWELEGVGRRGKTTDAILRLQGKKIRVEAKREIGPTQIAQLATMADAQQPLLAVAEYITPAAKKILKAQRINYIDGKGNMFLKVGKVHIYIDGIPNPPQPVNHKTKLLGKAGLQVIFHLLTDPRAIDMGYRELARRAGVALGNMPAIFQALKTEGYLIQINAQQQQLIKREQLCQAWAKEYGRRLKPGLVRQRFRATTPDFRDTWERVQLPPNAIWGGQPGAHILLGGLTPGRFTLYTAMAIPELIKQLRWMPDAQGNIEVIQPIWTAPAPVTPPALLVYADLLDDHDERATEIAGQVYDKFIRKN